MASLLGLPPRPTWRGQDLLAADYAPRPTLVFGRAAYETNGIVDGQFKYIEYPETHARMLFDLSVDPLEQHDLTRAHGNQAERYHSVIASWLPVVEYYAWAQNK